MGAGIGQQPADLVAVGHHHADDIAVIVQLVDDLLADALRDHLDIGASQQREDPQHRFRHAAL